MAHAFLITAYRDPDALEELVEDLGPTAQVYIHWDRKAPLDAAREARLIALPGIRHFSRRYAVNWGSTRHLLAILHLAREAVKDPAVSHLHTLTGSDRPILSTAAFAAFFEKHPTAEFIGHHRMPSPHWSGGGLERLTLYHPLDQLNVRRLWPARVRNYLVKGQRLLGVRRSLKGLPPLHGGSTWWSLTSACVRSVLRRLDEQPALLQRFNMTHVPEEILFQTLVMDSEFAGNVVNDDLRYIDWTPRNGNEPAVLDSSDLEKITRSGKLFARKLEHPISTDLIAALACHRREPARV
jgi:hypothetical protein